MMMVAKQEDPEAEAFVETAQKFESCMGKQNLH